MRFKKDSGRNEETSTLLSITAVFPPSRGLPAHLGITSPVEDISWWLFTTDTSFSHLLLARTVDKEGLREGEATSVQGPSTPTRLT